MLTRAAKYSLRIIALGAASVLVCPLDRGASLASGPGDELSSGRYAVLPLQPQLHDLYSTGVSVGAFSPRLQYGVPGTTDNIYFECLHDQGLVSVGGYSQFSDFVRNALIEQLSAAGIYSAEAPVQLTGELEKVELFYDQIVGEPLFTGTWSIEVELQSSLGVRETFSVSHSYPLPGSGEFCQEMAVRFMSSVQKLMEEILESENLEALLSRSGSI